MIELRDVVKTFDGFRALDGACVTVPDGAVYGLVGPNGAGKDPDAEREYLEVFRTQVRSDSNAVTTEVLSDTLEGVGDAINIEGLGGLLTFSAEVSQETADTLRDPGQFAGA